MTNLGKHKHTLSLVLIVHVHAGEEDTVPRVGVNPAEEDEFFLLMNLCNVF